MNRQQNVCKIPDSHRSIYFILIVVVNLLGIACLLVAWNAKGINEDNILWAMLLVAIVAGSGVLVCCFALFFICKPWTNADPSKRRIFDVQTVYPTPEFQYFTNTMLNRVQSKIDSRASDFSVVSTVPAGSPVGQSADDSSMLEFSTSPIQKETIQRRTAQDMTTTCTGFFSLIMNFKDHQDNVDDQVSLPETVPKQYLLKGCQCDHRYRQCLDPTCVCYSARVACTTYCHCKGCQNRD